MPEAILIALVLLLATIIAVFTDKPWQKQLTPALVQFRSTAGDDPREQLQRAHDDKVRELQDDQVNRELLRTRMRSYNERDGARIGDFVQFPGGEVRRISHLCSNGDVQTSDAGSFYLGDGYVSFSGALFVSVPLTSLTLQPKTPLGQVWFFHHDFHTAGGSVTYTTRFRLFLCDQPAPTV